VSTEAVIEARGLRTWFPLRRGLLERGPEKHLKAVDGVNIAIHAGEVLGLAGESGCGKSTVGMTLLQLHPPTGGEVRFQGIGPLAGTDRKALLAFRRQAQIIFQNPYESLNPRHTVEMSVREPVAIHFPGDARAHREHVLKAMTRAGLAPAETYLDRYPYQLSGGQLQRVAIARAISLEPHFLVADEPVSMLDVSIRAGILNLLRAFAAELKMAVLYISHDLSTMRHICSRVAVMYLGRIVEEGPAGAILDAPRHPYAQALIAAVPIMGGREKRTRVQLAGVVPNAADVPQGCRFHPRCPKAFARCQDAEPELKPVSEGHLVACHLYD
jgi:oligopeptide/dipeptide ABC transporter ATP-binding protein